MRRIISALTLSVLVLVWGALCLAQSPSLHDVKAVYFWPMRYSLDQYLAEQLSAGGPFQVVVDPKLADAIITERIDAPFLKAMDELFPTAGEPKAEPSSESSSTAAGSVEGGLQPVRPANRPQGRPEGTVFVVQAATRKVLWSTFLNQKDVTAKKLHEQARDIISRLRKDLQPNE